MDASEHGSKRLWLPHSLAWQDAIGVLATYGMCVGFHNTKTKPNPTKSNSAAQTINGVKKLFIFIINLSCY